MCRACDCPGLPFLTSTLRSATHAWHLYSHPVEPCPCERDTICALAFRAPNRAQTSRLLTKISGLQWDVLRGRPIGFNFLRARAHFLAPPHVSVTSSRALSQSWIPGAPSSRSTAPQPTSVPFARQRSSSSRSRVGSLASSGQTPTPPYFPVAPPWPHHGLNEYPEASFRVASCRLPERAPPSQKWLECCCFCCISRGIEHLRRSEPHGFENRRSRKATMGSNPFSSAN